MSNSELNQFGKKALHNWRVLAPTALSQMDNPKDFFLKLGVQAQSQWADLWPRLVEPDLPGEDFFSKVGRIEAAKMSAAEVVTEDLLLPPESERDVDEELEAADPLARVHQEMQAVLESL